MATSLLMVALVLVGLVAVRFLPRLVATRRRLSDHPGPDVLSGREPDVMATTVTAPLEEQLGGDSGPAQMTSQSSEGAR